MIPGRGDIEALALFVEREQAKDGWDNLLPWLGIVMDMPGTGLFTCPFPVQPATLDGGDIVGAMVFMADAILTGQVHAPTLPGWLATDVAGVIFTSEGWFSTLSPEERGDRRLADIPGSLEVRAVYVLDCAGRATMVQRIRGQRPKVEVDDGDNAMQMAGRVIDGLRKLLIWLSRDMPFGSIDLDRVRQVGVNVPESAGGFGER